MRNLKKGGVNSQKKGNTERAILVSSWKTVVAVNFHQLKTPKTSVFQLPQKKWYFPMFSRLMICWTLNMITKLLTEPTLINIPPGWTLL